LSVLLQLWERVGPQELSSLQLLINSIPLSECHGFGRALIYFWHWLRIAQGRCVPYIQGHDVLPTSRRQTSHWQFRLLWPLAREVQSSLHKGHRSVISYTISPSSILPPGHCPREQQRHSTWKACNRASHLRMSENADNSD
jgi:hypothetical protein